MHQHPLHDIGQFYLQQLLEDCLPFWLTHAVDSQYGGVMTSVDRDGSIVDTDKGVWQQGRFAWLLGKLFNDPQLNHRVERDRWLKVAVDTGHFLSRYGFDSDDGRMYFHLDRTGRPIRKRRYSFSEAFAAMAFGELAKATGEARWGRLATDCFDTFQTARRQPAGDAKFSAHRELFSIGPPMIAIGVAQQLRDSIHLPDAASVIDDAIDEIQRLFVKPELECVMETVGKAGAIVDHFDGRTLNPGHAIEAAWFLMEESRFRQDDRLFKLGCQMLDWMFARGWDKRHGGLLYFVDLDGKPVQEYWHDMKFWWPHNETILATLYAYEQTGNDRYLQLHRQVHDWAFQHFADPEHGEWFGYLHHDGSLSVTLKGNLWKGPFHYPRMLYMGWKVIERISASRT